jgi:hypothetical protein
LLLLLLWLLLSLHGGGGGVVRVVCIVMFTGGAAGLGGHGMVAAKEGLKVDVNLVTRQVQQSHVTYRLIDSKSINKSLTPLPTATIYHHTTTTRLHEGKTMRMGDGPLCPSSNMWLFFLFLYIIFY